jgi:hypothetical protein
MNIKTIEKTVQDKMNEWLNTITDESLRKRVKDSLLVSGGCIASMLLNESVNDFDVYIQDMNTCRDLALYYTKDFKSITVFDGRLRESYLTQYEEHFINNADDDRNSFIVAIRTLKENQIKLRFDGAAAGLRVNEGLTDEGKYLPAYFSPNAISLYDKLQIVTRFVGTPEVIHSSFDFIHATNYFTFADGFVRSLPAMESLITKQLKYQGSFYPVTSVIRAKKFVKRGFNIGAGEMVKIMFQISQLDLSNPDVLEEQLVGVDVAYFDLLIQALRNRPIEKGFKVSSSYFNTIIDRVFNSYNPED